MPKSIINISLPGDLVDKFDEHVVPSDSNRSAEIERLMRKALDLEDSVDREMQRRLQELKERREERVQTREEIEDEIEDFELEIKLIEEKMEEEKRMENKFEEAVSSLESHLMKKRRASTCSSMEEALSRLSSSEPFWNWVDQLDCGKQELKSALKEEYVQSSSQEVDN